MKIIIDRFEGDFAICELPDKSYIDVPSKLFPDACEGDVVDIIVNEKETLKAKQSAKSRLNGLFDN